jgi:quercetin dioxygenase-like cupin family protein
MLIQIEQRRVNPTLATLVRLGEALDIGLAELVELGARQGARVISRDEAVNLWSSENGSSGRLLVGSEQLEHIELWDWRLAPGDKNVAEAHLAGTKEIIHVLAGDLVLDVGGESYDVTAGESIVFSADADHCYENKGDEVLRLVMVVVTPPASRAADRGR